MMMAADEKLSQVIEAPELLNVPNQVTEPGWLVVVYNNESNTYEEVMTVLMLATECDADEAYIETWEIDHLGHCAVHRDSKSVCENAAKIISMIGIRVEVSPEI